MLVRKITGVILSMRPHAEFDRIVSVFSPELGMTRIIAKGVRRMRSRRGYHLDLLNHIDMEIEEPGNGSFSNGGKPTTRYLREVSVVQGFMKIKGAPERFAAACVVASFLVRVLPEGAPQTHVFDLTKSAFHALEEGRDTRETLLTYFLKVTRALGYMPHKISTKEDARDLLWKILNDIDPQFTLQARRTLGTFSKFESTISS